MGVTRWTGIARKGYLDFTFPRAQGSQHQPPPQPGRAGNLPRCSREGLKACSGVRHKPSAPRGSPPTTTSGAAPANTEGGGTRQGLPRQGKGPRCPSPLPERSPAPEPGARRLPGIPASLANPSARPPSPRAHQGSGAIALSPPAFGHFLLAAADYGGPRGSHPAVRPGRDRNLPFPPMRVRCGLQGREAAPPPATLRSARTARRN